LPCQKRYGTTAGDDTSQLGQATRPIVAERGNSVGTIPGSDLAPAVEADEVVLARALGKSLNNAGRIVKLSAAEHRREKGREHA
jgi:hypothetical protein